MAPSCSYADNVNLNIFPSLKPFDSLIGAFTFALPTGSNYITSTEIVKTDGNRWTGVVRLIPTGSQPYTHYDLNVIYGI